MKEKYITDDEREKCRKVADAFAELYEIENILVVDAGRYGFVKLQYYRPPQGFEDAITFTDSRSMFENLWEEWFDTQLFLLAKGTPMAGIRTGRCRSEVLMQEEVTQKTIALVIKTAKLDANVLKAAMRMYLNHRRQKAQKTHGKTSVKKLVGEGVGVSSIEVTDGNIKSFERVARKYNVDFAVKKDKTTAPPKYVVFFKGRDADAVAQAFKEFVYGNEKRKSRTSVREKLKRFRDAVSQNKNRERSREKNKDRGQSL